MVNKLEVETSKPTGGVMVTDDTKLVADTLKEVEVDDVPYVVVSAASVPDVVIVGETAVIVIVELLPNLTVLVEAFVRAGIKYMTIDVLG